MVPGSSPLARSAVGRVARMSVKRAVVDQEQERDQEQEQEEEQERQQEEEQEEE